jgi:RNA recognition motif-containing protein
MAWLVIIENLGSTVSEAEVRALLAPHGEVESVHLRREESGTEPTQVASVQVQCSKQGCAAIAALDGREQAGRPLKVKVAKGDGRAPGGLGGGPGATGRSARASVYGGKGGAAGHKGIGKGGGRGL